MEKFLHRHLNFIDYAIWNLIRNKLKNTLIFLMFTFCIFLISSVIMFTSSIKREANQLLSNAPDIIVQKNIAGRHELIEDIYIGKLKSIKGISNLKVRLWGYYFEPNLRVNLTLLVPLEEQPNKGSVFVGNGVAKILKKAEKDYLALVSHSKETLLFEIEKVLDFSSSLLTNDLVILNEKDFRELTGVQVGKYTDIAVFVNNKKEIDKVGEKIFKSLPNIRIITKNSIIKTYDNLFNWRSSLIIFIISIILVAFFIIAVDRFIGISENNKNEIGLLKAVGWDIQDTIIMKSWECIIISLLAFFIGVNLAYFHIFLFDASMFKHIIMGWSVLYPQFNLVPALNIWTFIIMFSLTVLPFILFSIISVWRVSIIEPDITMR